MSKCFYHTDLDGQCSAAIIKMRHAQDKDLKLIPINYSMDFPFDTIKKNEKIFIVDFSLKMPEFRKLMGITKELVWIDHHKTAIEDTVEISDEIRGLRRIGTDSGCKLTWEYFYHPTLKTPRIVELVSDYDAWVFKHKDETKEVKAGLESVDTEPEHANWVRWFNSDGALDEIRNAGIPIIKYQKRLYKRLIEKWGYSVEFEGYKAIVVNIGVFNSDLFEDVSHNYDIMIDHIFDGKKWTISLYTINKDIDVGKIAKKFGGGGHPGAAGFIVDKLESPFKKNAKQ